MRNCTGRGRPASIILNDALYTRCPRAVTNEDAEARYLVNLYFHCERSSSLPHAGGPADQTNFVITSFEYIAEIIALYRQKRADAQAKKSNV